MGSHTQEGGENATAIHTTGGQQFIVFSKNQKWDKVRSNMISFECRGPLACLRCVVVGSQDLWSELVTPKLKTNLLIETWMNGATTNKVQVSVVLLYRPQLSYSLESADALFLYARVRV
jgi:hypothetical protein